ncbi:hypothetical protein GCM10023115_08310 [Pontixanthobacter gangjinensis]
MAARAHTDCGFAFYNAFHNPALARFCVNNAATRGRTVLDIARFGFYRLGPLNRLVRRGIRDRGFGDMHRATC